MRLKANALAGSTVTLKLKSADFKIRTRARALGTPTQLAARNFAARRDPPKHEVGTTRFRLIGIGVSNLEAAEGDDYADLIDRPAQKLNTRWTGCVRSSAATRWSKAWRWTKTRAP